MTLEAAIQENTTAVRELIAQLKTASTGTTGASTVTLQPVKEEKAGALTQTDEAKATKEPSYQDAAKAITDLARAKGRTAAEEVLKRFGAEKLPQVKAEDFAAVIAACSTTQESEQ